jgi:hypothetical protein
VFLGHASGLRRDGQCAAEAKRICKVYPLQETQGCYTSLSCQVSRVTPSSRCSSAGVPDHPRSKGRIDSKRPAQRPTPRGTDDYRRPNRFGSCFLGIKIQERPTWSRVGSATECSSCKRACPPRRNTSLLRTEYGVGLYRKDGFAMHFIRTYARRTAVQCVSFGPFPLFRTFRGLLDLSDPPCHSDPQQSAQDDIDSFRRRSDVC